MPATKTKKTTRAPFPKTSKDIPATQGMLELFRKELKSEMKAGFRKIEARFTQSDGKFASIDGRFEQVDARFQEIDARFDQVDARFQEVDARFDRVDARFQEVDARFDRVEARFQEVDARFDRVEAQIRNLGIELRSEMQSFAQVIQGQIESLRAEVSRLSLIIEEQNSRNRVVLDGIAGLWQRQEKVEQRVDGFEAWLSSLRPASPN